jgi:hypothetical protein
MRQYIIRYNFRVDSDSAAPISSYNSGSSNPNALAAGQTFTTFKEFKEQVARWAFTANFNIRIYKSDKKIV